MSQRSTGNRWSAENLRPAVELGRERHVAPGACRRYRTGYSPAFGAFLCRFRSTGNAPVSPVPCLTSTPTTTNVYDRLFTGLSGAQTCRMQRKRVHPQVFLVESLRRTRPSVGCCGMGVLGRGARGVARIAPNASSSLAKRPARALALGLMALMSPEVSITHLQHQDRYRQLRVARPRRAPGAPYPRAIPAAQACAETRRPAGGRRDRRSLGLRIRT